MEKQALTPKLNFLNPSANPFEGSSTDGVVRENRIHIVGFEFDGTACFRKGTVKGPEDIRSVVYGIETYSPYLHRDFLHGYDYCDLGNLPVGTSGDAAADWQQATDAFFKMTEGYSLKEKKVKFLTLGGEHSISYAPIKKYLEDYDDLVLLHLDAHADLRDGYEGYHYSHASIIRRALDHFGPGHKLVQYGIRSGTREEYEWMESKATIKKSLEEMLGTIDGLPAERPIYLTLDLDYFDPAYMPGTGTPEPGGETFHSFIRLLKILERKNLVGADVVELSPEIDPTGNSSVFAAKVVREILLSLGREGKE